MAKSVTQALVGILVRKGKLEVAAPADVPAWRATDDPRRALTLDQLLRMTSGLEADDDLDGVASTAELLFGRYALDMEARAIALPLAHPPGTRWAYSTATTMVVAGIVGRAVGGGKAGLLAFMRRELFDPLGMRSAVPEFDAAGTFMGGGFVYATARDWARFGLLYLRDGRWDGARILPEGWVDYARTPAPAQNNGVYGAHFWLNGEPGSGKYQFPILPGGPASAFGASGARGQYVVLLPTRDLILVRLGEMETATWADLAGGLAGVAAAFPDLAPAAAAGGGAP
jgi:CubicO group peptidase (beta-lactamase class C family)